MTASQVPEEDGEVDAGEDLRGDEQARQDAEQPAAGRDGPVDRPQ